MLSTSRNTKAKILLIDDEVIYHKMVARALESRGCTMAYAKSGLEGLKIANLFDPDVVILDVRMPDLEGYEVAKRLRHEPKFARVPIIFITGQTDLDDKLKAFQSGADDYLIKPFQPEELAARVALQLRRSEELRAYQELNVRKEPATIIAVHSLRGGVGCTSLAVNLGIGFVKLWEKTTLIFDAVLNAGQVSLMLNASPLHTLNDLADRTEAEVDDEMIAEIITKHSSRADFIASPPYPTADDAFSDNLIQMLLEKLRFTYDFIIFDTPHDFSNFSIHALNAADHILMLMAPDMASIRAAICSMDIYKKLGYPPEKIVPVVNNIYAPAIIKPGQIEKVLKVPIKLNIPNAPNEFNRAINYGQPFIVNNPESIVTSFVEDLAFEMSNENLRKIPPAVPTTTWNAVNDRKLDRK
jgi:pilus assembly protein CpaE